MRRFFGAALLALAAYFALLAWPALQRATTFQLHAASMSGTVIDVEMDTSGDGAPVFRPRIEYTTPDGIARSFMSENGTGNAARYAVGDGVGVRYLLQAPEEARIDRFSEIWGAGVVLTVLFLLAASVAIRLLLGAELWERYVWIGPLRHWHGVRLTGLVLLLVGIGLSWSTWNAASLWLTLKLRGVETEGTVIELVSHNISERSTVGMRMSQTVTVYRPRIEYRTHDGRTLTLLTQVGDTVQQNESLESPSYVTGEKVRLRYLKERPEQAQVGGFMEIGWLPLVTGVFALLFLLIGVLLVRADASDRTR